MERSRPNDLKTSTRRSVVGVVVALVMLLGWTGIAGADPARPTDYRSRVISARPPLPDGVHLEVAGGDSFLDLEVDDGHTVVVPDYESGDGVERRPYLRFGPDGIVERNEHSAAAAANESRYGSSANPDVGPTPLWKVVSRDGRYTWHDHRIHWMLPQRPNAVDVNGRVDLGGPDGLWTVDLVIDGVATTVQGELVLFDAPSPVPWYLAVLAVAVTILAALALTARAELRRSYRLVGISLAAVGTGAAFVAWSQYRVTPPGAGADLLDVALPAAGAVAGLLTALVRHRQITLVATAVSAAALAGWAILRLDVLSHAVLPTDLPFIIDRSVTSAALGAALAAAALLAWRPPLEGTSRPPVTGD